MPNESTKAHHVVPEGTTSVGQTPATQPPQALDLTRRLDNNCAAVRYAKFIDMPNAEQMKLSKQIVAINEMDLGKSLSLPEISIDFDNDYFTNKPQLSFFHLDYEPGTKNQELQSGVQAELMWDKGV